MKILAIPATNSRSGMNRALLGCAEQMLADRPDVEFAYLDLNDHEMPIYSPEREAADGVPPEGHAFYDAIGAADAVIVSFAEYNGSFTPAWKNTYDWASRIDMQVYQGKPVLMLAATPGPRGGAGVLNAATMAAPFFGAELVGSLGVASFHENYDPESGQLPPDTAGELAPLLAALITAAT